MADVSIRATALTPAPMDYKVPGAQEIAPKSVSASMDGTSAAAAWFPCLQLLDPAGNVMFSAIASSGVAAGASADVSWFPRVGSGSKDLATFIGARLAVSGAGQTVNDSTNTDLTYASVSWDTDSMADLGADARILTVNTAGYYLVSCRTTWPFNTAGRRINAVSQNVFYSGGSPNVDGISHNAIWTRTGGGGGASDNLSMAVYKAQVGDFFASGAYQASGGSLLANNVGALACYLQASLIGV